MSQNGFTNGTAAGVRRRVTDGQGVLGGFKLPQPYTGPIKGEEGGPWMPESRPGLDDWMERFRGGGDLPRKPPLRSPYERFEDQYGGKGGLNEAQIQWLKRRVLQRPEKFQGTKEGDWFQQQIGDRIAKAGGIEEFMAEIEEGDKAKQKLNEGTPTNPKPGKGGPTQGQGPGGQGPGAGPQPKPPVKPLPGTEEGDPDGAQRMQRLSRIDLPPELMPHLANLEDELAAALAEAGAAKEQIAPMVHLITERMATDQGLAMDQTNQGLVGSGIYNSGWAPEAHRRTVADFDRQRQDLGFDVANQYRDIARMQSGAYSTYNRGLADLLLEAARVYSEDPTYGITDPSKPKPRKKSTRKKSTGRKKTTRRRRRPGRGSGGGGA